ncbi:MAG: FecR domain-containing protein, partial [Pseudomonadota bacterium]
MDKSIREQAIALMADLGNLSEAERGKALDEFRKRSATHAQAVEEALLYQDALAQLPKREFSALEQRQIKRQAQVARMLEPRRLAAGGSVAVIVLASFLILGGFAPTNDVLEPPQFDLDVGPVTHSTTRNTNQIVLEDGSTIWLDWHSTALVHYSKDQRQVALKAGRAAFKVSSDVSRPFIVESKLLTTRVTGTEFIVDARETFKSHVSVIEGSVDVTANEQVVALGPGQVANWSNAALEISATPNLINQTTWREGRLVLRNATLIEAFEMLEPYSIYDLDTSRLQFDSNRISATYFVDRANEAVIGLIQSHNLQ